MSVRCSTNNSRVKEILVFVMDQKIQIIAFYEFKDMASLGDLTEVRDRLKVVMAETGVRGTILLGDEGYNSTLCGSPEGISQFVTDANLILDTTLQFKSSFHDRAPFRKIDVKIKPEIVTLKQKVNMQAGDGTHVSSEEWNKLISDPEVYVLDTRNDYEFEEGTFKGAINPRTEKFSDLPRFVAENLDPTKHKKIAMFCTGGIRCEKFAPYMVEQGFEHVYQLRGGILKYIEETQAEDSLWEGECFVFDDRRTVDHKLNPGRYVNQVREVTNNSE